MAVITRRFLSIISAASLLMTAAPACRSSKAPRPQTIHKVVVGPSETQVEPESQEIWSNTENGGDRVHWDLIDQERKPDHKRKLVIEFERPDAFSEITLNPNSHRFRVKCPGASCDSGPIAKGATGTYKYWQVVIDPDGTEHAADGRIIIKP